MKWVCNYCGEDNVEVQIWVNINKRTLEDIELTHNTKKAHCHKCKADFGVKQVEGNINLGLDF